MTTGIDAEFLRMALNYGRGYMEIQFNILISQLKNLEQDRD